MSQQPREEPCPYCGEPVPVTAARCRACGRDLTDDEEDDRPRRRPPPRDEVEAADFLVPMHVSPWALAACYLGLIGFCLPFVGVPFALIGFICGIIALRRQGRQTQTYGRVTGNIRAIIGIVLGGLGLVIPVVILLIAWANGAFRRW
jgi:hypothetical protein